MNGNWKDLLRDSNLEFREDARARANGGAHFVEGARQQGQPPLVLKGDLTAKVSPGSCCGVPHSRVVRVPEFSKAGRSFPRIPSPARFPGALEAQSYFVSMGGGWLVRPHPLLGVSECTNLRPWNAWHSAGLRPIFLANQERRSPALSFPAGPLPSPWKHFECVYQALRLRFGAAELRPLFV